MNLTININPLLKRWDLDACVDLYRNAGFDAMDYPLFGMVKGEDAFLSSRYKELAREVRSCADSKGLPITQTHAPYAFLREQWENPVRFRDEIMHSVIRSIEISGILGAKVVVVHPIHHITYKGNEEELFRLNMEYYGSLIPYAKEHGVKIGVENMWQRDPLRKCIVADTCSEAEEFVRYIDSLDSEYITGCLDVGHVGLPVSAKDSVGDVIRKLGHDRLGALHIHDNDFCGDDHLLPYLGKLDWTDIAKALGEIDYQGDFTYEVGGQLVDSFDEHFAPLGAEFMAKVGRKLMEMVDASRPQK